MAIVISMVVQLSFCLPRVAHADDEADLKAAFAKGKALQIMADYVGAAKAYERALELAPGVFGPEDINTAAILNNLAILYEAMGQYAKAEPLYQRSLKIRESKLGPDHPDVAAEPEQPGESVRGHGPIRQGGTALPAEPQDPRGPSSGRIIPTWPTSLNNLANLYKDMGQYAKAEPLYQRSLKIRESKLGPDHPDVATSLNNLAALYADMGQYAKAEPLYQRSLKISESKLGPDHPDVATSLNNLASLYKDMGQYAKAEPLYQRSLKISESKLGPDHPDVATSLNNLAICTRTWANTPRRNRSTSGASRSASPSSGRIIPTWRRA